MASQKVDVQVVAAEGVLYEGEVVAVSATNDTGKFAILPQHTNFISIIKGDVILHEDRRHAKTVTIGQGVIYCEQNKIKIYAGVTISSAS